MRTFIAIDPGPDIKSMIARMIQDLDTGKNNVKWIKSHGIHLTLKFLGNLPDDTIDRIKAALSHTVPRHTAFSLQFQGTGTFPPRSKSPHIIWMGIFPCPSLESLHQDLEYSLERIGIPKETRVFNPHLTLGRIKSKQGLDEVLSRLNHYSHKDFGITPVHELILFKSTLKPSGAEYTVLERVKLS